MIQNLLLKFANYPKYFIINGYRNTILMRNPLVSHAEIPGAAFYATKAVPSKPPFAKPKKISTLSGLREFLMHPLTWDRNNGYFNVLIGLALFGYCFCTACRPEKTEVSYESNPKYR